MNIQGQCHCGNVAVEIDSELTRADIVPRACDCGFCRVHAAKNWSDPNGRTTIRVSDESLLQRYRFAMRTADFLVCRNCGAYIGAVLSDAGGSWSTMNLRLTDLRDLAESAASYQGESQAARVARRKRAWTPTRIVLVG